MLVHLAPGAATPGVGSAQPCCAVNTLAIASPGFGTGTAPCRVLAPCGGCPSVVANAARASAATGGDDDREAQVIPLQDVVGDLARRQVVSVPGTSASSCSAAHPLPRQPALGEAALATQACQQPVLATPGAPGKTPATQPPELAVPKDTLYDYSRQLAQRTVQLEAEVAKLTDERDTLKAEKEAIGEHAYGLQRENGMLHSMGWSSMGEKADLEKRVEALSSEVATLRGSLQQTRTRNETLEEESIQLRASIMSLEQEKTQLRQVLINFEGNLKSAHAEREVRIGREAALSDRNVGYERQIAELSAEKNRLNQMVSAQHIKIAEMQHFVSALNAEKARTRQLKQEIDTAEMEMGRLFKENSHLDHMVSSLHVEAATIKTQHDAALAEIPKMREKMQQQATACMDLEAQVAARNHTINELQVRNAELDRAAELAQHEGLQHEKAASSLLEERAWLRQELQLSAARKREMEERLHAVIGENSVVKAHLHQVGHHREQLKFQHEQLAAETVALRSHADDMHRMAQAHKDESNTLQHRVAILMEEKEKHSLEKQTLQKSPSMPALSVQGAAL